MELNHGRYVDKPAKWFVGYLMCVQAGEVVCERFGPRVFRQTSGVVGDLLPNDYDTCTSQRSGL